MHKLRVKARYGLRPDSISYKLRHLMLVYTHCRSRMRLISTCALF